MPWTIWLTGLVSAFLGSLGFALIFRVRARYVFIGALGGMIAYAVYLLCEFGGMDLFASNFLAAIASALFSEVSARLLKAPTVVFYVPCIIPLVPGGMLYYAMSYLLRTDYATALSYLVQSAATAFGIAGGLIVVSVVFGIAVQWKKRH